MTTILFYTADGRLTTEYADDCVVQWSVEDAVRLGLPIEREPETRPVLEPPKRAPRPADKAVRRHADK